MLAISSGQVFNNEADWVPYIIKDILTEVIYEVLWDDFDVYSEESLNEVSSFDLIDDVTGIYYQIFSYDNQNFVVPIKNANGDIIYGKDCFISAGGTALLNIVRNSSEIASVNDIEINIYDKFTENYLYLDYTLTEIKENFFKVTFIFPLKGDYLVIIKVMGDTFLVKEFKVYQYTYSELVNELGKLNSIDKYDGFI